MKKENQVITLGMFWFEDNTFATERVRGKKLKAIVELIKDGVVYGDLTVSELFEIGEQRLSWDDAKKFFENFSYPCQDNEKIVWYGSYLMNMVCATYNQVIPAFTKLSKPCRHYQNWSSSDGGAGDAWFLNFSSLFRYYTDKEKVFYVRPVIALKVA